MGSCVSKKVYQELETKFNKLRSSNSELIKEKEMDTVKEKHSRYIVTRKRQMMYQMHPIKWSAKRNLYHYYYDNPFSRIFRWRYNGIPKIFNEKYFSLSLSMMLFGLINQTDREVEFIKGSVYVVTIPYMILLSVLHKLYLFVKLPYALFFKIKTYGMANKVENLFKHIINDIYSNDRYEKLQEYADSKGDMNAGEPFYTYKAKKYSFMFCYKLVCLFVYLCFRKININGKQIGFVDEPGIIILNYTYANFIKNRILTIYNGSWKSRYDQLFFYLGIFRIR